MTHLFGALLLSDSNRRFHPDVVAFRTRHNADVISLPLRHALLSDTDVAETLAACALKLHELHGWQKIAIFGKEHSGISTAYQILSDAFKKRMPIECERLSKRRAYSRPLGGFVAGCSDGRFQPHLEDYVINTLQEPTCVLQTPSPVKRLVEDPTRPTMLKILRYLASNYQLNGCSLFSHYDCGGFGGMNAFGCNRSVETRTNLLFLKGARRILSKEFPSWPFLRRDIFDLPELANQYQLQRQLQ